MATMNAVAPLSTFRHRRRRMYLATTCSSTLSCCSTSSASSSSASFGSAKPHIPRDQYPTYSLLSYRATSHVRNTASELVVNQDFSVNKLRILPPQKKKKKKKKLRILPINSWQWKQRLLPPFPCPSPSGHVAQENHPLAAGSIDNCRPRSSGGGARTCCC